MTADLSRAVWRKSSRGGANGDCVEVAGNLRGAVAVRDSNAFAAAVKHGEFDLV